MRSGLRLVVAAALAALLGACTPAPSGPDEAQDSTVDVPSVTDGSTVDTGGGPPPSGAAAWCALAPPSLVASTLGIQLRTPAATFTSEEIRCTYVPVAEGDMTIAIRFRTQQTPSTFAAYRASLETAEEPASELAGVGDEAFYLVNEFDVQVTTIVVARRGSVAVQLEAPVTLASCTDLVKAILAQLG